MRESEMSAQDHPSKASLMGLLMKPASIALIGASSDPMKLAGRPVAYLSRLGFAGAVYPITPHLESMHGFRCYADLDAVPGTIDVALISRPAAQVLEELEKCIRRGIRAFVVLSGGFAETSPEGAALQERLTAMCREAGAILCGPNSAGLYHAPTRTALTLSSNLDREKSGSGSVALLSNSGSIATICFQGNGHIYRRFVATGNEAVLSVTDFMSDALEDPAISGVVAFLETIRDPAGLRAAAKRAEELGKPIAILKAGRTAEGASVARSHTGALVDDDAIIDAVFDQGNLIRLHSIAELKAMAVLMHSARGRPLGPRIGVITPSGGTAVLITDALLSLGMSLPALADETMRQINAVIPDATASNPLDVTGFGADPVLFGQAVTIMARDPDIDVLLSPMGGAVGVTAQGRAEALTAAAQTSGKLVVPIWQSSTLDQPGYQALQDAAMPVLTEYDLACRCVAALVNNAARADELRAAREEAGAAISLAPKATRLITASLSPQCTTLDEPVVKDILAAAGIRIPKSVRFAQPQDAGRCDVPFPAVLKIVSRDITHKNAAGGVASILDQETLPGAAQRMLELVGQRAPDARVDGFLLEEMVTGGIELLVGIKRDARFGAAISLGLGGVLANDLGRPVTAMLPLSASEARRMVRRFSPSLDSGPGAAALVDLLRIVAALGEAWGNRLDVLEINPVKLIVSHDSATAWALDGLVETVADPAFLLNQQGDFQ